MVADDRLAVMLAKSLVELDIAVPRDWTRAERDPTSFLRIALERWIHVHGGFIDLATGPTSVLRVDPQCGKRTRGLNKHYTPSRRGQQDAFDVGSSQERVDGSDLRVLSARLRSPEPGRVIQKPQPCATK